MAALLKETNAPEEDAIEYAPGTGKSIFQIKTNPEPYVHAVNCKQSTFHPKLYVNYELKTNRAGIKAWEQTSVFAYPRVGSFEVFVNKGRVRKEIFSKLKCGKWPNVDFVADEVIKCVEEKYIDQWKLLPKMPKITLKEKKAKKAKHTFTDMELRLMIKKRFNNLMSSFKFFDTNGDGCIDKKEFATGLAQIGLGDLPKHVVNRMWALSDADDDGLLTYPEFIRKFAYIPKVGDHYLKHMYTYFALVLLKL